MAERSLRARDGVRAEHRRARLRPTAAREDTDRHTCAQTHAHEREHKAAGHQTDDGRSNVLSFVGCWHSLAPRIAYRTACLASLNCKPFRPFSLSVLPLLCARGMLKSCKLAAARVQTDYHVMWRATGKRSAGKASAAPEAESAETTITSTGAVPEFLNFRDLSSAHSSLLPGVFQIRRRLALIMRCTCIRLWRQLCIAMQAASSSRSLSHVRVHAHLKRCREWCAYALPSESTVCLFAPEGEQSAPAMRRANAGKVFRAACPVNASHNDVAYISNTLGVGSVVRGSRMFCASG